MVIGTTWVVMNSPMTFRPWGWSPYCGHEHSQHSQGIRCPAPESTERVSCWQLRMRREALPECVSGWTAGVLQWIFRGDRAVQLEAAELPQQRARLDRSSWAQWKAQGYKDLSHMESVERLSFRTVMVLRNSAHWTKTSEPLFNVNGWVSLLYWKPSF